MAKKKLTPEARKALLEIQREVRELIALLQRKLGSRPSA
jgi:hypothetical protein